MDIFYEIDLLLQEKLVDEDLDKYEDDEEDGEKREDPLEIIGDILIQIESTKDNIVVFPTGNWLTNKVYYNAGITRYYNFGGNKQYIKNYIF